VEWSESCSASASYYLDVWPASDGVQSNVASKQRSMLPLPESHSETRSEFATFGIWDMVTVVPTVTQTVDLRSSDRSRHPQIGILQVSASQHSRSLVPIMAIMFKSSYEGPLSSLHHLTSTVKLGFEVYKQTHTLQAWSTGATNCSVQSLRA